MVVFNSLGSNYRPSLIGAGWRWGKSVDTKNLSRLLIKRYQANSVALTYKGREAITLVLRALQLPDNGMVAINGFTCFAVYEAVVAAGLRPLYLDIEKNNLNFSPKQLEKALKQEPGICAVIVQNTLAMPADVPAIKKLCKAHKIRLIEDLAHCVGVYYRDGSEAGTVGDATILSFSQDKMIDAVSGGAALLRGKGAVTQPTKQIALIDHITTHLYPKTSRIIRYFYSVGLGRVAHKILKTVGLMPRPMSGSAGTPRVLQPWYAHLTLRSFDSLDTVNEHRKRIATIYRESLPSNMQFVHTENAAYLRFPLLVEHRPKLVDYLKQKNIYIGDTWYDAPIAPVRFLSQTDYVAGSCPQAEYVAKHIINLPTHINVSEAQAHRIATEVNRWLRSA